MTSAEQSGDPFVEEFELPMTLELTADNNGDLNGIRFPDLAAGANVERVTTNMKRYSRLNDVKLTLIQFLDNKDSPNRRDSAKVFIDVDDNLRYEHVVEAIGAVSGYKKGRDTIKLVDKVEFANSRRTLPPRKSRSR